jgi:hypothetical protein
MCSQRYLSFIPRLVHTVHYFAAAKEPGTLMAAIAWCERDGRSPSCARDGPRVILIRLVAPCYPQAEELHAWRKMKGVKGGKGRAELEVE